MNKVWEIQPFIESINQYGWIRNSVGAHFNRIGEEVSDNEVLKFGKITVDFTKTVVCPISGEIPNSKKSGSYFESKSGKTRLYPIVMPGLGM